MEDNWQQYAKEEETTAQQVIERHREDAWTWMMAYQEVMQEAEPAAVVIECGNLYAQVKATSEGFGRFQAGTELYLRPVQQESDSTQRAVIAERERWVKALTQLAAGHQRIADMAEMAEDKGGAKLHDIAATVLIAAAEDIGSTRCL